MICSSSGHFYLRKQTVLFLPFIDKEEVPILLFRLLILLSFGIRTGDGSDAALAVPLLNSMLVKNNHMATFLQAGPIKENKLPR
jgi:hypothetical protein